MLFGLWKKAPLDLVPGEEVEVAFSDESGNSRALITNVLFQERKGIGLLLPRQAGFFTDSLKITVHFIREQSLGSFQSQVTALCPDDRFPHAVVAPPALVHWQRIDPRHLPLREFPSADLSFPAEIDPEGEKLDCITSEISGSGLTLLVPRSVPEETELTVLLRLPGRDMRLEGRVISSSRYKGKLPKGSNLRFESILNFLDISLADQDYLLHLITEKGNETREIPLAPEMNETREIPVTTDPEATAPERKI